MQRSDLVLNKTHKHENQPEPWEGCKYSKRRHSVHIITYLWNRNEYRQDAVIQCDALNFEKPDRKPVILQEEGHPPKIDLPSANYVLVLLEGERQLSCGMTHGELTAIQRNQLLDNRKTRTARTQ